MTPLMQALINWDGKSAVYINETYTTYQATETFVSQLVNSLSIVSAQRGGSWCLKKHLEKNGRLTTSQTKEIYHALPILEHWETELHILQCLPFLTIGEDEKTAVAQFTRQGMSSNKKFVRAWAYNGFYELAKQHPSYLPEATQLLENALEHESGSVKARIKRALKGK